MGADEFFDWMAYDMLKDEKFRKRVELHISRDMDDEERSIAIKQMFEDIRGK